MAQSRLETAQKRLAQAIEENSDKVDALKTAVASQQQRVEEAQKAYDEFIAGASEQGTHPKADIEQLKKKVLAAQTRVDKAKERLDMAKEQGLDTVDALQMGLDKQQAKLDEAKSALTEASA